MNFAIVITIQQENHNKKNTISLIVQCNNEPIPPLAPISPTNLNATLKATKPIKVITMELTK